MATYLTQILNAPPPPREEDWRGPGGIHFDDLTYSWKLGALNDNDVVQLDFRMPFDENWLIHQMRVYNDDGEPFDNVSVMYRRPGRELNWDTTKQWDFTTGPQTTYNLFFDGTGGGGSVTYGIESANWKQPPYFGARTIVRCTFYVNDAAGWAANNVAHFQFLIDRIPVVDVTKMNPSEILERLANYPMGGWFDR